MSFAAELLARACGAEPVRVLALATGLERARAGRLALDAERRNDLAAAPELVPLMVGAVLVLMSLGIAMTTVLARSRPDVTTFVIAMAHAIIVLILSLVLVIPAELADDDARALAGWPITAREIAVARLVVTLRPALLASAACAGAPLIAFAIAGPIPVVSGVLLACGIALQAIAIPSAVLAAVAGIVNLVGRVGARRSVLIAGGVVLLAVLGGGIVAAVAAPPHAHDELPSIVIPAWAPPAWTAAWGLLFIDVEATWRAALGLLAGLVTAPLALRFLGRRGEASAASVPRERVRPAPLVAILAATLAPFTRGREGWVVRRVLAAHAREDWRHGLLRLWPTIVAGGTIAAALIPLASLGGTAAPWLAPSAIAACATVLPAIYAPLAGLAILVPSSTPEAAWLLAQGDLDAARIMAAVRGVVRGLCLLPIVLVASIVLPRIDVPASGVVTALALALLTFELSLALFQQRFLVYPFSRRWQGEPDLFVLGATIAIVPICATVVMALLAAHRMGAAGVAVLAALLGLGVVSARRALARRIGEEGLHLELAPGPTP